MEKPFLWHKPNSLNTAFTQFVLLISGKTGPLIDDPSAYVCVCGQFCDIVYANDHNDAAHMFALNVKLPSFIGGEIQKKVGALIVCIKTAGDQAQVYNDIFKGNLLQSLKAVEKNEVEFFWTCDIIDDVGFQEEADLLRWKMAHDPF